MQTITGAPAISKGRLWTGRVLSGLVILFLLLDGVMKFMKPAPVIQACSQLGWPDGSIVTLGAILLVCTALYAIPKTSILGAILLTGYFGGAVAVQMRVGNPLLSHTLFPVYMGVVSWLALSLRNPHLHGLLLPSRSPVD